MHLGPPQGWKTGYDSSVSSSFPTAFPQPTRNAPTGEKRPGEFSMPEQEPGVSCKPSHWMTATIHACCSSFVLCFISRSQTLCCSTSPALWSVSHPPTQLVPPCASQARSLSVILTHCPLTSQVSWIGCHGNRRVFDTQQPSRPRLVLFFWQVNFGPYFLLSSRHTGARPRSRLVIGKGGEVINRLQTEAGCRVQVSQDTGASMRIATLTGTPASIESVSSC